MIVADANIVAYLMIEGDKTALAQQVLARDPDWLVPPMWIHEFTNIMVTYAKRDRQATERYASLLKDASSRVETWSGYIDPVLVLEIALQCDLAAYDAEYVHLARISEAPLVTEDAQLLKRAPDVALSMANYLKMRK